MKTVIVKENQSLLDVAISEYGAIDAAMTLAAANGVPVTYMPAPGSVLVLPAALQNVGVLRALKTRGVVTGTANIPTCPIVTDMAVTEITYNTATVTVVLPDDGVGLQYAVVMADVVPEAWNVMAGAGSATIELEGLLPGTGYWFYCRTVCEESVSGWRNVTFETLSLGARVVLYPKMRADVGTSGVNYVHFTAIALGPAPEYPSLFVNEYDLLPAWLAPCAVKWQRVADYDVDGGSGALTCTTTLGSGMTAKSALYQTPTATGESIFFADPEASPLTLTYVDVMGNTAINCAVVLVSEAGAMIAHLIADMAIEQVGDSTSGVTIRVTKTHPVYAGVTMATSWMEAAEDGEPDPDDPMNPDKTILTLGVGSHTIGVQGVYERGGISLPKSFITMVIEVS